MYSIKSMGDFSLPFQGEPALYNKEDKKVPATEANTGSMLTLLTGQNICQPSWLILTPLLTV